MVTVAELDSKMNQGSQRLDWALQKEQELDLRKGSGEKDNQDWGWLVCGTEVRGNSVEWMVVLEEEARQVWREIRLTHKAKPLKQAKELDLDCEGRVVPLHSTEW